MTDRLPVVLIAAVARNGVIGRADALPWRLPGDMRHFKAATMGRPLLMGRKTFQSIGRPLPGRSPVVVSRDPGFAAPGVAVAHTPEAALEAGEAIGRRLGAPEVMVAGGGLLYAALIGRAQRLLITEVDLWPEGDTRFPAIDPAVWSVHARETPPRGEGDEAAYAVVTYERR